MTTHHSVMITDGSPHPAEKWAEKTAELMVDVGDHLAGEKRNQAEKLKAIILSILTEHHTIIQEGERDKLESEGHERHKAPLDPNHHLSLDNAVKKIIDATKGTPWEFDFAQPAAYEQIKHLLRSHFVTSMHIERKWNLDRYPQIAGLDEASSETPKMGWTDRVLIALGVK